MITEKKVVALLDEEDAAALLYYYTGEVKSLTTREKEEWSEEKHAEVRRLIKKAAYFAGHLDDIEKQKAMDAPQLAPAAITRAVSGA